jgi:hypothetical protein
METVVLHIEPHLPDFILQQAFFFKDEKENSEIK